MNVVHLWDGGRPVFGRYLRTVETETAKPSLASSSRMQGLPHVGLARHIWRINSMSLRSTDGRPPGRRDFQRQNIRNPVWCHLTTVCGRR